MQNPTDKELHRIGTILADILKELKKLNANSSPYFKEVTDAYKNRFEEDDDDAGQSGEADSEDQGDWSESD